MACLLVRPLRLSRNPFCRWFCAPNAEHIEIWGPISWWTGGPVVRLVACWSTWWSGGPVVRLVVWWTGGSVAHLVVQWNY